MTRRAGPRVIGLACLLLVAACSNSSGDGATSTAGDPDTSVSVGDASQRDTFVPLSGIPGVTDDAITFAAIGTKAGNPLGICILDCYVDGIEAYFAFRNSEGGIFGRDLVLADVLDDELVQNQARSLDVISSGDAFGAFQATLVPSGWGDLAEAGVPTYTWGIHSEDAANREGIFPSTIVRCADCTRPNLPWIAMQEGATRAASIGYGATENSQTCTNMVADSFEKYADESGVELAYRNDDLKYGLPEGIGPEVTAMAKAGVDFIATCIDLNGMKTLAQELDRQGLDDVTLYHPNSYDHTFIAESDGLFEGDIVLVQFRPFETAAGDSTLDDFTEWMAKQGSQPSELSMVGWINASYAFDGLLAAGPEFDRATVIAATNTFVDYTAGGLVQALAWSDSHIPFTAADPLPDRDDCSALVRVADNAFVPYGTSEEPWLCWANGGTELEPTPRNFD